MAASEPVSYVTNRNKVVFRIGLEQVFSEDILLILILLKMFANASSRHPNMLKEETGI